MEKRKKSFKELLKRGIIDGFIFALGMAVFDYFDKTPFSLFKFLFLAIFFGGLMACINRYTYDKN